MNKPDASAFVRELVYGVLEHKMILDYYIDLLVRDGVASLKIQELTDFFEIVTFSIFSIYVLNIIDFLSLIIS